MQFTDEWLVPTVETFLSERALAELRATDAPAPVSLWDTLVQKLLGSKQQILAAIGARFRMPVADASTLDPTAKPAVPELLVRKFNVLPIRITVAFLEVATAN